MSKSNKNPSAADQPEYARPPEGPTRYSHNVLLDAENYIGQYVIVHSAPTAWQGILINVERRGEAIGCTLADAGLWINGELKEVIVPGGRATKDTESSHHHIAYVPIVTALQPGAAPFTLKSWTPKPRGRRPGDPNRISLSDYAAWSDQDNDTCVKALQNAYKAAKGFESVVTLVQAYADERAFPAPAVASMLLSHCMAQNW